MSLRSKLGIWIILCFSTISICFAKLPDFTELAAKNAQSVVNIKAVLCLYKENNSKTSKDNFKEFFTQNKPFVDDDTPQSLGSGVIISNQGYIVTNNHVIDKARKIIVSIYDNESNEDIKFFAKVVGVDYDTDLALLKIDTNKRLNFLKFANSSAVKVGEWVIAIGNPFGLGHSVTAGIISAKGRIIGNDPDDFIQTDASINPGNSGGALLNMQGEIVGINTMFYASGQGLGFAIPSNRAKAVADEMIKYHRVRHAWLGVILQENSEQFFANKTKGLLIGNIEKNSPAEFAGLKKSDIILQLNSKNITTVYNFIREVRNLKPAQKINLKILRKCNEFGLDIVLSEYANSSVDINQLGITVQNVKNLDEKIAYKNFTSGIIISNFNSEKLAHKFNFRIGDVILAINGINITSEIQFEQLIKDAQNKSPLLKLMRGDEFLFLNINMTD